jgi:integrase
MRRGEALALKWKHIDMGLSSLGIQAYLQVTESLGKVNGKTIIKEPKTLAGKRRVALSPSLTLVLRQYRTQQDAIRKVSNEDYVFCHVDGTPYDPSTVSHGFQ